MADVMAEKDQLEERVFVAELELSATKDSGILAGHSDAYRGGAIYDTVRNQIVSVSRASNNCRDVYLTRLNGPTNGKTELKKNAIPFDAFYRFPVYDGARYVYFTEATIDGGKGQKFGRLDLETGTFENLPALPTDPFKHFATGLGGCYSNGVVYMADADSYLCGYSVERAFWFKCGLVLPTDGEKQLGRLLSDPLNQRFLYFMGVESKSFLYQIDLKDLTCTILSPLPDKGDEFSAVLVHPRTSSENFVIVAEMANGKWYMYYSKRNSWRYLSKWKTCSEDCIRSFLVYAPFVKSFFFHINKEKNWQCARVSDEE